MESNFYSPNLINSLPQDFQEKIQKTWPKVGKKWLTELPNLLKTLSKKWSLHDIEPFKNLSYHFVAKALQSNVASVVLKIGCDPEVSLNEYRALRHFSGSGSIQVLDYDEANFALLLEAAIPGIPLNALKSKEEAISAYADVVQMLSLIPKPFQDFPHVRTWLESIEKMNDARIDYAWIEKSQRLRQFLLSSSPSEREYLCHGDLHFDNVISQGDYFVSIDPKGIIGEMAFEASAFDLVSTEEMENPNFDSEILLDRVHQLAAALKLNPERLLGWIFLRIMLSIQWSIEDQGDPSRMIKMGERIYPILSTQSKNLDKEIAEWALEALSSHGYTLKNNLPEDVKDTPWSCVVRFETTDGYIYLKQTPKLLGLEASITQILHDQFHASVPKVIAHNAELDCFLMKDAGRPLREVLKKQFDAALLCKAIDQFTSLQLAVADHVDIFLEIGVPDWRLDKLPGLYQQLLSKKDLLIADGLSEREIIELTTLIPKISNVCQKLSGYSIKQSLVQPDFHDNNILIEGSCGRTPKNVSPVTRMALKAIYQQF